MGMIGNSPSLGSVVPEQLQLGSLVANAVAFLDANKQFKSTSALTFNGTTLTANALTVSNATTLSAGTANGVAYLNASKVLTTGSALTFDGLGALVVSTSTTNGAISVVGPSSGTNSGSQFNIVNGASTTSAIGNYSRVIGGAYNESLAFFNNGNDFVWYSGSERMRLTSTGLGIGTSSPNNKLTVEDSAAYNGITIRGNAAPTVRFFNGTSTWKTGISGNNGSNFAISKDGGADDKLTLDSSGNLGLGVTPSANTLARTLELQSGFTMFGAYKLAYINGNSYFDGSSWRYKESGTATRMELGDTGYRVFTAPSGTAGNAISFTQAMTLDASGSLLVGATSGTAKVTLAASSANGSSNVLDAQITSSNNTFEWVSTFLASNLASGNNMIHFIGKASTNRNAAYFGYKHSADGSTDNLLTFGLHSVDNVLNINGNAQVLIGTQSFGGAAKLVVQATGSNDGLFILSPSGGSGYVYSCTASSTSTAAYFITSAGQAGYIALSGNSTNYYSGSDYRLKNNVRPITSALDKVSALRPVAFEWKSDGKYSESFLAHELAEQFPFAVGGEKDAVDADGNPVYQCIDTSFLVATLTAAIQEQQAIIEQLKSDVAALKGAA